jgi:hypothetical protein
MMVEPIRPFGLGSPVIEVDVLAENPLADYVRQLSKRSQSQPYGEPPEMFHTGARPPFLASGIDPGMLRKIRYELRHTAALEESRSRLLMLVEASTPGGLVVDPEALMSPEGRKSFNDYRSRIWTWATAGPEVKVSYTAEDFDKLFGPPADQVEPDTGPAGAASVGTRIRDHR